MRIIINHIRTYEVCHLFQDSGNILCFVVVVISTNKNNNNLVLLNEMIRRGGITK